MAVEIKTPYWRSTFVAHDRSSNSSRRPSETHHLNVNETLDDDLYLVADKGGELEGHAETLHSAGALYARYTSSWKSPRHTPRRCESLLSTLSSTWMPDDAGFSAEGWSTNWGLDDGLSSLTEAETSDLRQSTPGHHEDQHQIPTTYYHSSSRRESTELGRRKDDTTSFPTTIMNFLHLTATERSMIESLFPADLNADEISIGISSQKSIPILADVVLIPNDFDSEDEDRG